MAYANIRPSGGDTGSSLNLHKRLERIENYTTLRGRKVIDCGCGRGQYLLAFLESGADAYGVEFEPEKVAGFRREHPIFAERVSSGDIEAMEFDVDSFDLALLNEVLEHVPHEARALQEVHRILKPGGLLVVFSPNRLYPFETHSVFLKPSNRKLPLYVPFIPYIPLGLGHKIFNYPARNYWPHQLRRQVRVAGFRIVGTGFVWQTFEDISGQQPRLIAALRPAFRRASAFLEGVPGVRAFGVSQLVVAQKST